MIIALFNKLKDKKGPSLQRIVTYAGWDTEINYIYTIVVLFNF